MSDTTLSPVSTIRVRKRDGKTTQEWNNAKIERAISRAFQEIGVATNGEFAHMIKAITDESHINAVDGVIDVETIQQIVKKKLMDYGCHQVAEAYIVYAHKRAELRRTRGKPDLKVIQDFIHLTRYAKYRDDLGRRETFTETVDRSKGMHKGKYPQILDIIDQAYTKVYDKTVLPSMRSMQYAGDAQLVHNAKGYNCSFSVCNRIKFFSEAFYLLLCGTGTGYSVQYRHVEQLPEFRVVDKTKVKHYVIPDNIEGWADAANELFKSFIQGYWVEFSYHKIRDINSRLKTSGGRAPGHLPLRNSLENLRSLLLKAQGRRMEPIECYDAMCILADAVYASGIREAATICLFDIDDPFMMYAKTGDWYKTAPWRARANNSVVLVRGEVKKEQFKRIFKATKQWGEPGFFFCDDPDSGTNPCVETGLNPKLTVTPTVKRDIEKWAKSQNRQIPKIKVNDIYWGWNFCNLCDINCAATPTREAFLEAAKAAAIIGTLQAGYTDFPYLGWVTEFICTREALLGVSLTGVMDNPDIALNPEIQKEAAQLVVETNIEIAEKIGINSAARLTCIKPSGTSSIYLGAVGSGIHPHHARRYFRRIRANPHDPVYKLFKKYNPHMCIQIDPNKDLIIFPVQAPDGAIVRRDLNAIQFMDKVVSTMQNWVLPGTAKPDSSPNINHSVSNTITVKRDEWDDVAEYIWKYRKLFTGVSLLAETGDKDYTNAPREEVAGDKDEAIWQHLIANYKPVDWSELRENEDNTTLAGEGACVGGKCELHY